MNDFSPATNFREFHKSEAEALKHHATSRWLSLALEAALAECSYRGAGTEQLKGARDLINVLINLHEKPSQEKRLPPITLTTYEQEMGTATNIQIKK